MMSDMNTEPDPSTSIRASSMCVAWCIRTRRPYMGRVNPFFDDPTMESHDEPPPLMLNKSTVPRYPYSLGGLPGINFKPPTSEGE